MVKAYEASHLLVITCGLLTLSLTSSRAIASGDYTVLSRLEHDVQKLIRGRFQGPEVSFQVG